MPKLKNTTGKANSSATSSSEEESKTDKKKGQSLRKNDPSTVASEKALEGDLSTVSYQFQASFSAHIFILWA